MKWENFNTNLQAEGKDLSKPRILVAPLDWGLGHATRCIPVIYELISRQCDVWLAGEGAQLTLLQQEFPDIPFLHLPGYRIKYGRSAASLIWNILRQTGKIIRAIRQENNWLKEMAARYAFDGIISDNRYGLYHKEIPCVFITHQLTIKSPFGKWQERLLQKRNYSYITRFNECWVPDNEGPHNLAGSLSHPTKLPAIPVYYTGPLTRFKKASLNEIKGHLLILLSGPEPQRTILENKIIRDIAHYEGSATIARGLPGTPTLIPSTNSIKFYNHLSARELEMEMSRAEYIIGRSGYSTVMDVYALGKKSILIPTPGQTEQQYLARYLQGKNFAITISQKDFSLASALQAAQSFPYDLNAAPEANNIQSVIRPWMKGLKSIHSVD